MMVIFHGFSLLFTGLVVFVAVSRNNFCLACTNVLVTPGASENGTPIIAYNADSETMFGSLYHYPALTITNGTEITFRNADVNNLVKDSSEYNYYNNLLRIDEENNRVMRQVYDWDSGQYLGEIPEALETNNVVGNGNEHGLVIAESTFGGVSILKGQGNNQSNIIDYGSLIWMTLQRAKTIHEAIDTMIALTDEYGYASEGETMSLTDLSGEIWMLEMIGRGPTYGKKGVAYVAVRIPDGNVAAHANHARIRTFPRDDPTSCRYSPDIVDVAVHYGLYPKDADPANFSFADAFMPLNFLDARFEKARVWDILGEVADPHGKFRSDHLSLVLGSDLANEMPLYVEPYKKLTVQDVSDLVALHFENTALDPTLDAGAGVFRVPYRPRPLVWFFDDDAYFNERTVATPRTGWTLIAEVRLDFPPELAAMLWFATDDASTSPRFPIYCSSTRVPAPYAGPGAQDGVIPPVMRWDMSKAFWVQNMVANLAYYRWMHVRPIITDKRREVLRDGLEHIAGIVDPKALALYQDEGPVEAVKYVTECSVKAGEDLHQKWIEFYGYLFVRFRDFYSFELDPAYRECGCKSTEVGMTRDTKRRIVEETGDHYKIPDQSNLADMIDDDVVALEAEKDKDSSESKYPERNIWERFFTTIRAVTDFQKAMLFHRH